jgi:molecular chaperone DnaK (HSP70)
MAEKDFFITAIPMVDVQESTHIPTVLFYENKNRILIGSEAKSASEAKGRDTLNEDFKIDLGNDEPASSKAKRLFRVATGDDKSAGEMTGDFLGQLLRSVREWLPNENINETAGIVIAEPLTMQGEEVSASWLTNYRSNLRRILLGKGFTKDQIDFLPEPFAVFQYYKYGLKHPLLGQAKQCALVLDFGGGSFDVCIIETDKEGEVTGKRKNTRPLAASSAPIGGFFINRTIAEALFLKYAKDDKEKRTKINKGLEVYRKWRSDGQDLSLSKTEFQNFARNFHNAIYDIEDPKLTLCNVVVNWELDAPLSTLSVPVRLPKDPFSSNPEYFNAQLTAIEFREVFVQNVWRKRLEPIIRVALQRGKEELGGAPITVVLLSGGSCNIRWLDKLLEQSFAGELGDAQVLQLEEDFQEVVAKGVAVECTRRFYDADNAGDFTSVTYNRLHLVLDSDEKGYQLKVFTPTAGNPVQPTNKHGVLLPSASVLRNQFDKPLTWRVRLDKPPRKFLDYYFLRTGFSPQIEAELEGETSTQYSDDLLNLNHRVYTPPSCPFDSSIHVELKIEKETKTARVKFIYVMGTQNRECTAVDGKPFYIDMTDTQDNPSAKAYIGLDFGTSNTSVSYVSQASVKTYQKRSADKFWLDLNDLYKVLPYPLATSLARYLREYDPSKLVKHAREFVEASLAMAAYVSYLEVGVNKKRRQTHLLSGFTQRSVGPLWKLLQESLRELGKDAKIALPYRELISDTFYKEIDQSVTFFGQNKHEKEDDKGFNPRVVQILANISQKVFSSYRFGFFENVHQERFKGGAYKGIFRLAFGSNTNFGDSENYAGSMYFPNNVAYLVNFEERSALPLQPLIFWYTCEKHSDEEHCYFYDKPEGRTRPYDTFSYKAAGFPCSFTVTQAHEELAPIADELIAYFDADPSVSIINF